MQRLSFGIYLEFYIWDLMLDWNTMPGKFMYRMEEHYRRQTEKDYTGYYLSFHMGMVGLK